MGTAVRPAKTSPASWNAFSDVDAFVDAVLAELAAMAADGTRRPRSGPKPTLTRLSRERGSSAEQAMTGRMFQRLRMKLVLRLVETGIDGSSRSVDVLEIVRRRDPGDIAAPGITLSQGKQLLGPIQQEVVAAQCRDHATR